MAEGEPSRVWDDEQQLETLTPNQRRKERKERYRKKGKLRFRFHRDYDVAQPHAEGFVIFRVFAPVKTIRPDFRVGLLRRELRNGEMRAVYTGCVNTDFIRLEDLDLQKFYYAAGEAKAELHTLQLKWDEDPRSRRSRPPKGTPRLGNLSFGVDERVLKNGTSILGDMLERQKVVEEIINLPTYVDDATLKAAEDRIARHILEEVDTTIEAPKTVERNGLLEFVNGLF